MNKTDRDEVVTSFNYTWDTQYEWNPYIADLPTPIQSSGSRLSPSWFNAINTLFPEQGARLINHFNLFQQYTIKKITQTWVPRWERSAITWIPQTDASGGVTANNQVQFQWATQQTSITIVQDMDDSTPRNSLDEFFQVRDQPNAKTFDASTTASYSWNPFVLDTISQENSGASQSVNNIGPSDTYMNMSTAVPFKWFATKAAMNTTGGSVRLNSAIGSLGCKKYYYTPFNNIPYSVATEAQPVGLWRWNVEFGFRFPEYRAPVTTLGFEGPGSPPALQALIEDMNVLASIEGEGVRLRSLFDGDHVSLGTLGAAYAQKRKLDGSDPNSEAYSNSVKRLRASHQIRESQSSGVAPVDPDSV